MTAPGDAMVLTSLTMGAKVDRKSLSPIRTHWPGSPLVPMWMKTGWNSIATLTSVRCAYDGHSTVRRKAKEIRS